MTTTKKSTMYQEIEKHGNNLNVIFNTGFDPVKLCKKLRRLELMASKIAEDYANGDISSVEIKEKGDNILSEVNAVLNNKTAPIFFNQDPRGYALKIKDSFVRENNLQIYRDWGGYGIICPDFTP